jgi:hypothetical protein
MGAHCCSALGAVLSYAVALIGAGAVPVAGSNGSAAAQSNRTRGNIVA